MFSYLQSRIRGTAATGPGGAAARADRLLLALRAADEGLVRAHVRHEPRRGADRHGHPGLHREARVAHGSRRPAGGARRAMAAARRHDRAGAARAPAGAARRRGDTPQRAHPGRDEPDPLAEPLARRAPELAVLPERFRRAHRQPRHADRQRAARERDGEHTRHLVHRGLRRERARADGDGGLAAGRPHAPVVRRLLRVPALFRAAHARSRARQLRGALARDGARGGQLHQHPHRQAVRAARRRGRLRARDRRRAPGRDRRAHAAHHAIHVRALGDERAAPHRHGGDRHLAVGRTAW